MKFKKLISIIVILVLMITSISYAEDNSNMGSVGEGYGTTDFDTRTIDMWTMQNDISIAKISLWDEETKEIIDSFIVSNYSSEDLSELRLVSNMIKTQYIELNGYISDNILNNIENNENYLYISNIIHIPDFPQLLLKSNEGEIFEKAKEYFSDYKNIQNLLGTFEFDKTNLNKLIFLIEPMGIFKVNDGTIDDPESFKETETLILLSSAEIGLLSYNKHQMFNCNIQDDGYNITPFMNYYHTQLYQVIPFSTFKTDIEKLLNIKACDNKYKNSWTINGINEFRDMINSLGCFEVYSFITSEEATKSEIKREVRSADVEYYTNSWVITSVKVSSSEGCPRQSYFPGTEKDYDAKNGCISGSGLAKITFSFDSDEELSTTTYTQSIAIPENGNALAWVKWKCPSKPCNITLNITKNDVDANLEYNSINIEVIDPTNGRYPPNPEATDRNDGFIAPNRADGSWNIGNQKTLEWTTYNYNWHYYWVWGCSRTREDGHLTEYGFTNDWDDGYICDAHVCPEDAENHVCPTGRCHSINEDWGWVEWTPVNHQVSITTSNEKLIRSSNSPNSNNSDYSIKSGYGVEFSIDTKCKYKKNGSSQSVSSARNAICPPQYMEFFMPEFNYENYEITSFNSLDSSYDDDNSFELPINPYSQFEQKCHFTPIWYPDGKYVVGVKIGQCFCPAGMLYICLDDISINIDGNAYDDWHIAPERN